MCQIKTHAGQPASERRCDCDTSAARRLRRHNATAIAVFSDQATPLMDRSEAEPVIEEVDVEKLTMQTIESIANDVQTIKKFMDDHNSGNYTEPTTITLEDGTEHEISRRTRYTELAAIAEKQTIKLGDTINQLVEYRTGITDASIAEVNKAEKERLEKQLIEILAAKASIDSYKAETWPAFTDETGKTFNSDTMCYRAMKADNPDALAYYDRCKQHNETGTQYQANLNKAFRGKDDETIKLTAMKRAELIKVLSEMREIGGTIKVADNSSKPAIKVLQEVEQVYPRAWVEASNQDTAFRAKTTVSRAHYSGGSFQDSYKVSDKRSMQTKDKDWVPDPLNRYQAGEWIKTDENGDWTDPATGAEYSTNPLSNEQGWIYTDLEYKYSYRNSVNNELVKPKGNGWKLKQIREETYDPATRTHATKLVELYARPVKERKRISSTLQPELTISGKGKDGYEVGLHEFAHRVENTKTVGVYIEALEEAHIKRRTTDEDGVQQKLQKIYAGKKEYGRPDNFADLYMGKEYSQGYREILSTGAESVFGDSFGGLIGLGNYKSDPEMKGLIVGLWASA